MCISALQDRVKGILFGLAAGDRNGGPIQMALRLAESLAMRGAYDPQDVGSRYLRWWVDEGFDTGPVAARVFELVRDGMTFERACQQVDREMDGLTAGCNPAHRVGPMAMCATLADAELATHAKTEALLTHAHPLASDVAAAVACLCRGLIRGIEWDVAVDEAGQGRMSETQGALTGSTRGRLSRGGFAPEALGAAMRFLHDADSFAEALEGAIDFAGLANYCPVFVGAIGGARWGRSAIRSDALRHCELLLPRLELTADTLSQGWSDVAPMIGIFWVYKGMVIGRARPLSECEENVPGLLDSPDSHIELWERTPDFVIPFPELRGVEYQTVPRGRVLYSTTEKQAIVYLDATLRTPKAQRAICDFFQLEESAVSWKTDEHYTTAPEVLNDLF